MTMHAIFIICRNPMRVKLGDQLLLLCGDTVSNLFIQVYNLLVRTISHLYAAVMFHLGHVAIGYRWTTYSMRAAMPALDRESSTSMATVFQVIFWCSR